MSDNSANTNQKRLLYEVSYIRPIVIFLLVLLHSFEKISAGGNCERDFQMPTVYAWMMEFIKGFRIETIALVAGYVFAFQCIDLGRKYPFKSFVVKKLKRLILPMLFFGTIYYFCFFFYSQTFSITEFIITLLSGCGHLWFLPMLFWCFITIWIVNRYKLSSVTLLCVLAAISLLPLPALPLGFARLPHFLFYVYGGYFIWEHHESIWKCLSVKTILALWLRYLIVVICSYCFKENAVMNDDIVSRIVFKMGGKILKMVEAIVGTMALYVTVCYHTTKTGFKPSQIVVDSSKVCYGMYVYHQFLLVFLYFYTPLYDSVNCYILPWIGFIITMLISLLFTNITLKTKVGRYLIG